MLKYFPFKKIRKGQDELIKDVEEVLDKEIILLAHAPTGLGKTVATLTPSLKKALEEGLTVFFLTPKHSQHKIAIDTLRKLRKKVEFKAIDIIGKRWLCNLKGLENLDQNDFAEFCAYLKKEEKCEYYNKIFRKGELSENAKEKIEFVKKEILHAEEVRELCKEVCAYEILTYAARNADVIICDYYHIFNPFISKTFLFKIDKKIEDSILIVDEAHLLPNRVRELLSFSLTSFTISKAIKECEVLENFELAEKLKELKENLENLGKENKEKEFLIKEKELLMNFKKVFGKLSKGIEELEEVAYYIKEKKKRSFCSSIARYMKNLQNLKESYALIYKKRETNFLVKQLCLDASEITKEIFSKCYSAILMSATLEPLNMYRDLLGIETCIEKVYTSPFPKENRLIVISPLLTSRFSRRTTLEFKKYAEYINLIEKRVRGNIAIFFPSYEFKDKVWDFLDTERIILSEEKNMNKERKMRIIQKIEEKRNAMLLAVQGGNFSEGVDFSNNSLKCIIIAGIGLAKPNLETKSLIKYYENKFGKGWEYAYIFPAIQKAIQASGRAIRSEKDRAIIIFLEERFLWKKYRDFLKDENLVISNAPWKEVEKFFKN